MDLTVFSNRFAYVVAKFGLGGVAAQLGEPLAQRAGWASDDARCEIAALSVVAHQHLKLDYWFFLDSTST